MLILINNVHEKIWAMHLQRTCLQCSIHSSQLWRFKNAFVLSLILEKVNLQQHQDSSSLVDGHFIGNIKVEFISNFNEMFPEFAEPWPPYLFFPVKVFSRQNVITQICTVITEICTDNTNLHCDNTNLHCDNTKLHCLGLTALLSANQNCEIFSCILL